MSWLWLSPNLGQGHGYDGDSPNHVGIPRIANAFRWPPRLRRRNKNKLVSVYFAPAAHVGIAEVDEINRAVKFVLPIPLTNQLGGHHEENR